jgi:hypothetical protein
VNIRCALLFATAFVTVAAFGQDWQDCKPDGSYSFAELRESVRRVVTTGANFGIDDKIFSRSGDLASLAVLQTFTDAVIASPQNGKGILMVLRTAFACPHRCVTAAGDRQPRVTLLLLEHLRRNANRKMWSEIDNTRKSVVDHAGGTE